MPSLLFIPLLALTMVDARVEEGDRRQGAYARTPPPQVLDAGCGLGVLSVFCAQAGARRVFAVDRCDLAVASAREVPPGAVARSCFLAGSSAW